MRLCRISQISKCNTRTCHAIHFEVFVAVVALAALDFGKMTAFCKHCLWVIPVECLNALVALAFALAP